MSKINNFFLYNANEMEQILISERTDNIHSYVMKILKKLKNFGRFLFVDTHKQRKQIKSYNRLLKKLEETEIVLKKKLKDENIEKIRETIEIRLKINSIQRRKAIAAIDILKNKI